MPPREVDKIPVELQNVFLTILKYRHVKEGSEHDQFMEASRSQDKYANTRRINPFPKGDPTGQPIKKYGKRNLQYRSKLEEIRAKKAAQEEEAANKKQLQGEVKQEK